MKGRLIIQREKGVTLIALVVTITVLLILASVTITSVFGDNGILIKAQEAANEIKNALEQEQAELNQMYNELASAMNNTSGGDTDPDVPVEPELPSDGSYSEAKGVNTPNLGEGMTPIKWNGSTWIETTGDDPEWYDYTNKKWANATTSDGSMWVWIPRYAYSIMSGYNTSTAGTIKVEFMKGTSNETSTGRTNFDNASGQGNWNIHPAFEYGSTVSGIWVAKFEASSVEGNKNSSSGDNVTSKTLQVKPNVSSWRYITLENMYTVCENYNKSLNSHLIKNDEWGAVAYLSKSKYGKETEEIGLNTSVDFITGSVGDKYTPTISDYTSEEGVKASTTGTIWGIYDMRGGAAEYIAAYVDNGHSMLTKYGESMINGEEKKKNVYDTGTSDSQYKNYGESKSKYGDALYETSTTVSAWYEDLSEFPYISYPFFKRGGSADWEDEKTGIFAYTIANGDWYEEVSFRPVLIVEL